MFRANRDFSGPSFSCYEFPCARTRQRPYSTAMAETKILFDWLSLYVDVSIDGESGLALCK